MVGRPVHADGFSAAQLLFPRLIQLCDDLLCFLLEMQRQLIQTELFIPPQASRNPVLTFPKMLASHLEPLNGLLTGRAEDAVVQVVD